jgi:hypothetical protein
MSTTLELLARNLFDLGGHEDIRIDTGQGNVLITREFRVRLFANGQYVLISHQPVARPLAHLRGHPEMVFALREIDRNGSAQVGVEVGPFPLDTRSPVQQNLKLQIACLRKAEAYVRSSQEAANSELLRSLRILSPPPDDFVANENLDELGPALDLLLGRSNKYGLMLVTGRRGIGKETCIRQLLLLKNKTGILLNECLPVAALCAELALLQEKLGESGIDAVLVISEVLGDLLMQELMLFSFENLWRSLRAFSQQYPVIIRSAAALKNQPPAVPFVFTFREDAICAGLVLRQRRLKLIDPGPEAPIGNPLFSILKNIKTSRP